MQTDLLGRLSNLRLPHSKPLAPLFECVINSMHAIDQAAVRPGRIDIKIRRESRQGEVPMDGVLPSVSGFGITDNGRGFDSANFKSFETSDSTFKRGIGGKGIGRLLWLKAFEAAQITSIYRQGAITWRRSFTFCRSEAGIEKHELMKVEKAEVRTETTVELIDIDPAYRVHCPGSATLIAERIIEHLLIIFLEPGGPDLFVHDDVAEEHIDVKRLYREEFADSVAKERLEVAGQSFTCHLARLYGGDETRHRFFLCAHKRDVNGENLQPHVPDLTRKLQDDRGAFVLLAYVTGDYLDLNVNQERTAISFADPHERALLDDVTRPKLVDGIVDVVKKHADPFLKSVRAEKREQIESYIGFNAPEYRSLLKPKYAEFIEDIPPHLPVERLESELHKRAFRIEQDVREQAAKIRSTKATTPEQIADLKQKYAELIDEENEIGKARLAKYVIHRKTILDLFERNLTLQSDGTYELESTIHQLICPLKTTSEEVPFEKLNLWIIDERLAFHHYLASDKRLDGVRPIEADSARRPDLLIFNRPIAFVDSTPPFQSVVIVEFKRPMREDYQGKDPITQVYEYAEDITKGAALDRAGRPIPVRGVPFYAYVICDITTEIDAACRKAALLPTPDGMGYFGFNPHYNTYIEVMAFSKIIENSKRRNRVFFEQLGLPASQRVE